MRHFECLRGKIAISNFCDYHTVPFSIPVFRMMSGLLEAYLGLSTAVIVLAVITTIIIIIKSYFDNYIPSRVPFPLR